MEVCRHLAIELKSYEMSDWYKIMLFQFLNQCIQTSSTWSSAQDFIIFFSHKFRIIVNFFFQSHAGSVSVVVKIWQVIKVRVMKPKFNDCHPFVINQQKSIDIENVFNMYNKIIVYFKDIHTYCDHRVFTRWVKLRSLCIQKICRGIASSSKYEQIKEFSSE